MSGSVAEKVQFLLRALVVMAGAAHNAPKNEPKDTLALHCCLFYSLWTAAGGRCNHARRACKGQS